MDISENKLKMIKKNGLPIVIWGFGGMITFIIRNLEEYGLKIDYIVENDQSKLGGFKDIPIISFENLKETVDDCNILIGVCTPKFVSEIQFQIRNESKFDKVFFFEMFYPFGRFAVNRIEKCLKEINKTDRLLADKKSKEVFRGKIDYLRIKDANRLKYISDAPENQYFDEIINLNGKQGYFLDCGAYHGENTEEVYRRFISDMDTICIDADRNNIEVLKRKWENEKRVIVLYGACGEKNGMALWENSGARGGMTVKDAGIDVTEIPMIGIDDTFFDKKIDFIKMDIEGSEKQC